MKFIWEALWFPLLVVGGTLGYMVGFFINGPQTAWLGVLAGLALSQAIQCWRWGPDRPYYWWTRK